MAATTWTVNIRVMTASNAPSIFGKLAKSTREAEKGIRAVKTEIGLLEKVVDRVEPKITRVATAFKGMGADTARSMTVARRSMGALSRTITSAANQSTREFNAVDSSIRQVRTTANSTANAIANIATAANRLPRAMRNVGSAAAGGSGSVTRGGGNWGMDPGSLTLMAAGAGAGSALTEGIKGAADLQDQTLQAAIAQGNLGKNISLTTAAMNQQYDIASKMARMTGQSVSQSMGVIAAMSSGGITAGQITQDYKPIAQFGDILHFNKKDQMPYDESAKMGAGIVHDFRLMNAADTAYGLGVLAQTAYLSPHRSSELITQVRRMAPTLENILPGTNRQKAVEITDLAAWADRMGNLPFAGSAVSQMITQAVAPRSKRAVRAFEALGVYDANGRNKFFDEKTGHLDAIPMLQEVAKTYKAAMANGTAGAVVKGMFGTTQNTARIMQALTSPEALTAYNRVTAQRRAMGNDPVAWMNVVQSQLTGTLSFQTGLLISNFSSLVTTIGRSVIPQLTSMVAVLAQTTGALGDFLHDHPHAAQAAGVGLAVAAAAGIATAILAGGYISTRLLGHLPGMHIAAHALTHFGGGGGAGAAARVGGAMGRVGRIARGVLGFGVVGASKGLFAEAEHGLIRLVSAAMIGGRGFLFSRAGILALGETVAKMGLKAIPVVGEILMLVDTIRFLGDHSKDIGKGIGIAAGWIWNHGGPMIVNAFKSLIAGILNVVTHPGNMIGGAWDWTRKSVGGLFSGMGEGFKSQSGPVKMATGGRVNGEGLAYLHRGEVVVNDRLTRKLDRMSGSGGSGRPVVIAPNVSYHAAPGESDSMHRRRASALSRKVIQEIAARVAEELGIDMDSVGANLQHAGFSSLAFGAGRPS